MLKWRNQGRNISKCLYSRLFSRTNYFPVDIGGEALKIAGLQNQQKINKEEEGELLKY